MHSFIFVENARAFSSPLPPGTGLKYPLPYFMFSHEVRRGVENGTKLCLNLFSASERSGRGNLNSVPYLFPPVVVCDPPFFIIFAILSTQRSVGEVVENGTIPSHNLFYDFPFLLFRVITCSTLPRRWSLHSLAPSSSANFVPRCRGLTQHVKVYPLQPHSSMDDHYSIEIISYLETPSPGTNKKRHSRKKKKESATTKKHERHTNPWFWTRKPSKQWLNFSVSAKTPQWTCEHMGFKPIFVVTIHTWLRYTVRVRRISLQWNLCLEQTQNRNKFFRFRGCRG